MPQTQLPPITAVKPGTERQYRTALSPAYYLRCEEEALQRGLTPYRFTQIIMTMYLDGRLIQAEHDAQTDKSAAQ